MASLDVEAYPNFMKRHFSGAYRTIPSLKLFHKGHMVSHWKDHDIHKDAPHDAIRDFTTQDFHRLAEQERIREAFGQFSENWGAQKYGHHDEL